MERNINKYVVDKVVELTTSKLSNTTMTLNKDGGNNVSDFMQALYDKLSELYTNCD